VCGTRPAGSRRCFDQLAQCRKGRQIQDVVIGALPGSVLPIGIEARLTLRELLRRRIDFTVVPPPNSGTQSSRLERLFMPPKADLPEEQSPSFS
jgi:hypothetical protein